MDNTITNFHLKAKEIWGTAVNVGSEYTKKLELQLELDKRLLNIFQVGSFYYFVFNIFKGDFDFVSDEIKNILGYEPEEFTGTLLMNKIHPEDKTYFLNYENASIQFFKTLTFEQIPKYKAQYDYRIKTKKNTYIRILQQVIQIDYDESNYYRSFGIHTDITHIKKEGTPCLSIIGLDGEPSYHNIQNTEVFTKSYDLFTNREREILKCIVESKSSKEIASQLHISLHTVHTHRKNILFKANCTTPIDLVTKTLCEGWV